MSEAGNRQFFSVFPNLLRYFPLLAALIMSAVFIDRIPQAVPIHWTTPVHADREGSRVLFVALFPTLQFIHLLSARITHSSSLGRLQVERHLLIGTILLIAQAVWFRAGFSRPPTQAVFPVILIGGLLVIGGFFMRGSKQNSLYGVRTSWTLGDTRVWKETHKVAGPATMITGAVCVLFGILLPPTVAHVGTIGITLMSASLQIYYSYLVAKRFKN